MINLGFDRRPSLSCFLSLFGFSSPSQRSRGIGGIWFITPEGEGKKKKKNAHRETSGKFCNFRQEKGQTPGLGQDELAAFQDCLEKALVCVSVYMCVYAHNSEESKELKGASGCLLLPVLPSSSSCLPPCSSPLSSPAGRWAPSGAGEPPAAPAGNIVKGRAPLGPGTLGTQGKCSSLTFLLEVITTCSVESTTNQVGGFRPHPRCPIVPLCPLREGM